MKTHWTPRRLLGAFVALAACHTSAFAYDQLVVFGDSLSDNGNLALAVGSANFVAQNYDPMRLTDGPTTTPASSISGVTVEHLNTLLGLSPLAPAIAGGSNYAWAGATTGYDMLDLVGGTTPGTGMQVLTYLSTHPSASPDSLYVLWAGANDLLGAGTPLDLLNAETTAITNLTFQASLLLQHGAQNLAWLNLPDLSITPAVQALGAGAMSLMHDASLKFRLDWYNSLLALQAQYPTAKLTGIDVYGLTEAVVGNPAAFGLINITDPAQGLSGVNPDQYLFWDYMHPTTRVDTILAQAAFQQLAPVPEASGSVYIVLACFGLIATRVVITRRRSAAAQA